MLLRAWTSSLKVCLWCYFLCVSPVGTVISFRPMIWCTSREAQLATPWKTNAEIENTETSMLMTKPLLLLWQPKLFQTGLAFTEENWAHSLHATALHVEESECQWGQTLRNNSATTAVLPPKSCQRRFLRRSLGEDMELLNSWLSVFWPLSLQPYFPVCECWVAAPERCTQHPPRP